MSYMIWSIKSSYNRDEILYSKQAYRVFGKQTPLVCPWEQSMDVATENLRDDTSLLRQLELINNDI